MYSTTVFGLVDDTIAKQGGAGEGAADRGGEQTSDVSSNASDRDNEVTHCLFLADLNFILKSFYLRKCKVHIECIRVFVSLCLTPRP